MPQKNRTMRILTGIAIILVILGHIDCNILTVFGLFPYYGFHVLIFVFVSGYFYKPENEAHIPAYIGKKALHLLVPYYIWNLVYGIASTIAAGKGFIFCNKITVFNFFIEPFLGGHQYGFNFAAWFVPALFLIEVIYICGRKILSLIRLDNEWLILGLLLAAGIATVALSQTGHVWGYLKTPGRILFMLPAYQLGRVYKTKLEAVDRLAWYIYFPIVIALQAAVYFLADGQLNFSAVWCSSFASLCFVPYVTVITGTAFWLRIAKLLSGIRIGRIFETVGDYSFAVMMHHMTFVFLLNLVSLSVITGAGGAGGFDITAFKENINYVYLPGGIEAWKLVYFAAALGGSVLIGLLTGIVKKRLIKGKI